MFERKHYIIAASAALLSALLYLPSVGNGFVNWDDYGYVIYNKYLALPFTNFLKWAMSSFHMANWHPLTLLSLKADYSLWRLDPKGYHMANLILHSLNSFLVALLTSRLFMAAWPGGGGRTLFASSLVGAVFAVHPLHVESVAWVSERKDVLYSAFWLLGLLSYLNYASTRLMRHYRLCLLFFVLSLMSKPMAVTFPVVLLILDYYPLGRFNEKRAAPRLLREKGPFIILSAAASVATLFAQTEAMITIAALPVPERLVVAARAVGFYFTMFFYPTGQLPLYPLPSKISFLSPGSLAAFIFFASATACSVLLRRAAPWLTALWAYYVITLLPTLGLVQVGMQSAADRYMYLPMLGPLMGISVLAAWAWGKGAAARASSVVLAVVFTFSLAFTASRQIAVWKDSYTLWGHALKVAPDAAFSHFYMGTFMLDKNRVAEALAHFDRAVTLDPRIADFFFYRGMAYAVAARHEEAVRDFTSALRLGMKKYSVYLNRGNAFAALKQYDKAIVDYNVALTLNPESVETYFNRAFVFSEMGSIEVSNEDYLQAIALNPGLVGAYNNLGINCLKTGDFKRAIGYFDRTLELDPGYGNAYFNRAKAYAALGDSESASRDYRKAVELGYGSGTILGIGGAK